MAPRALPLKHLVKLASPAEPFATRAIQQVAQTLNPVVDAVNALEDAYAPLAHAATHQPGGSDVITGIAPGAHAATHLPGGTDAIATASAVANPPGTASAEGAAASFARSNHTHALAAFGTGATNFCVGNDARLSDARIPTGAAGGALAGTYPNPTLAAPPALKPAWAGVCHGNSGDGDPLRLFDLWGMASVAGPTPTDIDPGGSGEVARCVKYRSRYELIYNRVRLFGIAATTGLYTFGLYEGTALLTDFGARNSAANTWLAISSTGTLKPDTDYWFCVATTDVGTTAGFRSPAAPLGTAFWKASAAPIGGRSIQFPEYALFWPSAGGVFPATLPTLRVADYAGGATGSVPFALFDSSTSDGT